MAQNLMTKFKRWVSGDDLEDDIYNIDNDFEVDNDMYTTNNNHEDEMLIKPSMARKNRRNLRLVDQHEVSPMGSASEVMVLEPNSFEESLDIVEHLRASRSVILNLHLLDTNQSQRVVDFLSGATHAIDGHQQRIGDGVFIFTPCNVNITSEEDKRLSFSAEAIWR